MINNFTRGDTVEWAINIYDPSSASVAMDITGATLFFTAKKSPLMASDSSAAITASVSSHSSAANGATKMKLTIEDTSVTPGRYAFGFQLVDASSDVTTLTEVPSYVYIKEGVTRRII